MSIGSLLPTGLYQGARLARCARLSHCYQPPWQSFALYGATHAGLNSLHGSTRGSRAARAVVWQYAVRRLAGRRHPLSVVRKRDILPTLA